MKIEQKTSHVKGMLERERLQLVKILNNWGDSYQQEKIRTEMWLSDVNRVIDSLK